MADLLVSFRVPLSLGELRVAEELMRWATYVEAFALLRGRATCEVRVSDEGEHRVGSIRMERLLATDEDVAGELRDFGPLWQRVRETYW